jgi:AraC-like DNA-binding protein
MEFHFSTIDFPPGKSFFIQKQTIDEFSKIHSHKNYELNFIISEGGKRIVGNNISAFENVDLILLGPDLPHNRELHQKNNENPSECLILYISDAFITNGLFQISEFEIIQNLFNKSLGGIAFKGNNLIEIASQMEHLSDLQGIESFIALIQLLNSLADIKDQEILSLTPGLTISCYKDLDQIKIVCDYVLLNLQEPIRLEKAAALLHMASGSFCRFFKKRTGKSFIQYIKDIRISRASDLLAKTEKPIAQICSECGYNNLANFNLYFKSVMKTTPSEYRKHFR